MSVLEAMIILDGSELVGKQFYFERAQKMIKNRADLINAITSMAETAFGDEIQSFKVGQHEIIFISKEIQRIDDPEHPGHLYMYAISDNDDKTNKKKILVDKMEAALFQFTNRFSTIDILAKNTARFIPFEERFDKIFQGLIYKTDEEMEERKKKKEKKMKEMRQIVHAQQARERQAAAFRRM